MVHPPIACLTLGEVDCRRAADIALNSIGVDDRAPIFVQVGPFGCRTGQRCAATLAERPVGDVLVEFAGVPAVTIYLTAAADGSLSAVRGQTFGRVVPPSSKPIVRFDPLSFSLGHCGLFSGIDVDGSWWDPIGQVDIANGDAVNAAEATIAFVDPGHATFVSHGGLVVTLVRRDGPKHLPFCD